MIVFKVYDAHSPTNMKIFRIFKKAFDLAIPEFSVVYGISIKGNADYIIRDISHNCFEMLLHWVIYKETTLAEAGLGDDEVSWDEKHATWLQFFELYDVATRLKVRELQLLLIDGIINLFKLPNPILPLLCTLECYWRKSPDTSVGLGKLLVEVYVWDLGQCSVSGNIFDWKWDPLMSKEVLADLAIAYCEKSDGARPYYEYEPWGYYPPE